MSGTRAALLENHNVLLLDNSSFSDRRLAVIANLLALIPAQLQDTGAIGALDLIGAFPAEIARWDFFDGTGGEIDIFSIAPGVAQPAFAHELNH